MFRILFILFSWLSVVCYFAYKEYKVKQELLVIYSLIKNKYPDIYITSTIRNSGVHKDGFAIDIGCKDKKQLLKVYKELHDRNDIRIGIGKPPADLHIHIDLRPDLRVKKFIEISKPPTKVIDTSNWSAQQVLNKVKRYYN